MKRIVLNQHMGGEILTHLAQFGALPDRGIVAGQAVASAIQDLYGFGAGVYNDVDVFRLVGAGVLERKEMANSTTGLTTVSRPRDEGEYSSLESYLEAMRTYRVSSVTRDGLLNYVNCALPLTLGRHLSAGRVIEAFDLNCVRVAVDLESKQLVWDRHFEKFVNSRQLEIVAVHTPWHTFLRLLKKLDELPEVYADLDASAEVACAITQSDFYQRFIYSGSISKSFGKKALETAEKYRSGWSAYFNLEQETTRAADGKEIELYSMEARGTVPFELMEQVNDLHCAALHYTAQTVYASRRKKSNKILVRQQEFREKLENEGGIGAHVFSSYLHVHGSRYLEGQTSPRHFDTVRGVLWQHQGLRDKFVDLTLDQQYELIKKLKKLEQDYGYWIYGALENQATGADLLFESSIRDLLDRFLESAALPINVEPLKLPALPEAWQRKGVVVEELLRPVDLMAEGEEMGHCVGGYIGKVRTNYSRILRIRTPGHKGSWSTVELKPNSLDYGARFNKNSRLQVEQHRSRFNKEPSDFNKEVLHYVVMMYKAPLGYPFLYKVGLLHKAAYVQAWVVHKALRGYAKLEKLAGTVQNKLLDLKYSANAAQRAAEQKLTELQEKFGVDVTPKEKNSKGVMALSSLRAAAVAAPRFSDMDDDDEVPF